MKSHRGLLLNGAMAFAYALQSVLLTVPLVFYVGDALPQDLGDPLLNTWILTWETQAITEHPSRLFDAPIFYPHRGTLAYSEPLFGILPFAFPFILATGIPALGHNIAFLASFWVGAMGMARLVQAWGGSRRAAFLAGWLFAAAPYRFAQLTHLHLLYAGWIPLAMAALLRYARRPTWRRALDLLLALLLMTLTSWHLALFGGIILALLGFLIWRENFLSTDTFKKLALVLLVWGIMTGLVMIPYLRVAPEMALHRNLGTAESFSAWPVDLLAAAPALNILGPLTAPFRVVGHTTPEVQLYPGLVPLLLAALALRIRVRGLVRQVRRVAWVVLLLGTLMALGPRWSLGNVSVPGFYAWIATLVPGISLVRAVGRWFLLALIGIHMLASIGLERTFHSGQKRLLLGIGLLSLGFLEGWAVPIPLQSLPRLTELPPAYYWLSKQPDEFAVVELPVFLPSDAEETWRMYAALVHRKPLVIAYSGHIPPDIRTLREELRTFPAKEARDALVRLASKGVRYVLVDGTKPPLLDFATKGICVVAKDPRFLFVARMGPHWVFELPNPRRKIPEPPPRYPTQITFADVAVLRGYGIRWLSDTEVEVWLEWEAGSNPNGIYMITLQAFDAEGRPLSQHDSPPQDGGYPFTCWQAGEHILERRVLSSPALIKAHTLGVGIYEWPTIQLLPVQEDVAQIAGLAQLPVNR